MRINAINTINSATIKSAKVNKRIMRQDKPEEVSVNNPSFKGNTGRAVGSILGFLGGCALVAVAPAVLAIPGLVAAGIATKAGGDAGDRIEEESKRRPHKP